MLSRASGTAIGSIQHFFKSKTELAGEVYEDVADSLIAACEAALQSRGGDVPRSVRALQAAYIEWTTQHSDHLRLLRELEVAISRGSGTGVEFVHQRFNNMLHAWSRPLIATRSIAPLSPDQLATVILGPITFPTRNVEGSAANDWCGGLTRMAMSMIEVQRIDTQPKRGAKPKKRAKPAPAGKQSDLFK